MEGEKVLLWWVEVLSSSLRTKVCHAKGIALRKTVVEEEKSNSFLYETIVSYRSHHASKIFDRGPFNSKVIAII